LRCCNERLVALSSPAPPDLTSRPRSLLYFASIDFPHVKARAIQVVSTCHALARAGCRVTLVVGQRERGPLAEHLARYGLEAHPGLRIVGVPALRLPSWTPAGLHRWYTRLWNWSYLAAVLLLLPFLLRGRPEALLARDYRLAWLLGKLRRWHRRRLVFEVHGLPSVEALDRAGPAPGPRLQREAERRRDLEQAVFDAAWLLLTITDCLRLRLIHAYAVTPDRVATVPDAARAPAARSGEPSAPPPAAQAGSAGGAFARPSGLTAPIQAVDGPRASAAATGGPSGLPPAANASARPRGVRPARLIYVGQLYPWKGVDLTLRALALLPACELTIVGGLPDDPQRGRLERLAAQLGVAERLYFTGPRPYREVPALLAQADVALLPLADGVVARCFTSPLKLFDYLAAGLPIVAVDFPTIREVLRDGENGLIVPSDDPVAMAAAVRRLLAEPDLARRLGDRAQADAREYTWERRAERILTAFARRESPDLLAVNRRPTSSVTAR
jgi:glycosyltransferase involved in cell wall biosynthesis